MSKNTPFVGAYWSKRKATKAECAFDLSTLLQSASGIDAHLSKWFLKGTSKKEARMTPIGFDVVSLERLLRTNNRDTDGTAISELGFNFAAWNGDSEFPVSFSITCGAFSDFVGNSALFHFCSTEKKLDFPSPEALKMLFDQLVTVLKPDHAVVSSMEELAGTGDKKAWEATNRFAFHANA